MAEQRPDQLIAFHQALLEELGIGAKLSMDEFGRASMICFQVTTTQSVRNKAEAMRILGLIDYEAKAGRGGGGVVVRESPYGDDSDTSPPFPGASP